MLLNIPSKLNLSHIMIFGIKGSPNKSNNFYHYKNLFCMFSYLALHILTVLYHSSPSKFSTPVFLLAHTFPFFFSHASVSSRGNDEVSYDLNRGRVRISVGVKIEKLN